MSVTSLEAFENITKNLALQAKLSLSKFSTPDHNGIAAHSFGALCYLAFEAANGNQYAIQRILLLSSTELAESDL